MAERHRDADRDPAGGAGAAFVKCEIGLLLGGKAFPDGFDARAIARRARRRRAVRRTLLAAVAMLLAAWPLADPAWRADYASPVGEVTRVVLPDGTVAYLDSGAAIAWEENEVERRVVVLAGMAAFDTAGDPRRAFTVATDRIDATALGTEFAVSADDGGWVTLVQSGRVRARDRRGGDSPTVAPGEAAWLELDRPGITVRAVDAERALAWRAGLLDFRDRPLDEVLRALDRYYPGRILLLDAAAGGRRFDGVVSLQDVQASVRAVAASGGLAVAADLPYLLVLR